MYGCLKVAAALFTLTPKLVSYRAINMTLFPDRGQKGHRYHNQIAVRECEVIRCGQAGENISGDLELGGSGIVLETSSVDHL